MDNPFQAELLRRQSQGAQDNPFAAELNRRGVSGGVFSGTSQALSDLTQNPTQNLPQRKPEPFNVLPFSENNRGDISFDTDAGVIGMIKRAINLPGDALHGKVDPTSDEGIARAAELASVVSPINPAVRAGSSIIGTTPRTQVGENIKPPTTGQLREAAKAGYKSIDNSDVAIKSDMLSSFADDAALTLNKEGLDNAVAPNAFKILDQLKKPQEGSFVTPSNIHSLQKRIKRGGKSITNPEEGAAAGILRDALEARLGGIDQRNLLSGRADDFAKTLREADANFAASKRSEVVDSLSRNAELRAAASNSGQNASNAVRQEISKLLRSPGRTRGFNDSEITALENAVKGSTTANNARSIANLLGKGGGIASSLTSGAGGAGGFAIGGVPGAIAGVAIPAVAGRGANAIDRRSTGKAFQAASDAVRSRSPLAEGLFRQRPVSIADETKAKQLLRALLLQQMSNNTAHNQ